METFVFTERGEEALNLNGVESCVVEDRAVGVEGAEYAVVTEVTDSVIVLCKRIDDGEGVSVVLVVKSVSVGWNSCRMGTLRWAP